MAPAHRLDRRPKCGNCSAELTPDGCGTGWSCQVPDCVGYGYVFRVVDGSGRLVVEGGE